MVFPERFSNLPPATWPRLRALLDSDAPGKDVIDMSIGAPKHAFPTWVVDEIVAHAEGFNRYPDNSGSSQLLEAISDWLDRRYHTRLPIEQLMVLNGTREGLFNATLALCPEGSTVLCPNPFYQAYGVAALASQANPMYLAADAKNAFLPDFAALDSESLNKTSVAFLCSPSNPQGAVADRDYWRVLLDLAEKYDFKIFADECYSEIYRDAPPPGGLEMAHEFGADPERVVVFHSLSKRSNLPGLRSGFVASGPQNIARIRQLRAYAGAPVPDPIQHASIRAWRDEDHVVANRAAYVAKFALADQIFSQVEAYCSPQAGFFLWLPIPDGEKACRRAWTQAGLRTLPGAYLSAPDHNGSSPGDGYLRVALVAPKDDVERGLIRLRDCLYR